MTLDIGMSQVAGCIPAAPDHWSDLTQLRRSLSEDLCTLLTKHLTRTATSQSWLVYSSRRHNHRRVWVRHRQRPLPHDQVRHRQERQLRHQGADQGNVGWVHSWTAQKICYFSKKTRPRPSSLGYRNLVCIVWTSDTLGSEPSVGLILIHWLSRFLAQPQWNWETFSMCTLLT